MDKPELEPPSAVRPARRSRFWGRFLLFLLLLAGGAVLVQTGAIRWPAGGPAGKNLPTFHCPMHPTVVSDRPGSCPVCGMDLVPIGEKTSSTQADARSTVPGLAVVSITPESRKLMGLRLGTVEKRSLARQLRTSARIVADETRLWRVSTKMEGWVDKLFIAYTGQEVKKGDPLLSIYSPDLVTAQSEYLAALRAGGNRPLAEAVRRRLELWDISADQIETLERTGKVEKNLTLYAPASGVVTAREILAGQKIMPGDSLMVIADLSVLWGEADLYQSDLPYVAVGMPLELALPYWPGKLFHGKVIFVSPTLDAESRTLRARLEIPNPEKLLKPGMFGDARLHYGLGEKLSIPASAVMFGGQRTYAFRDLGDGHLVPVEIKIGARSDERYELLEGLAEGDQVVASANFLVDSESNLKAALEALAATQPPDMAEHTGPAEEISVDQVDALLPLYLEIQKALASDDLAKATAAARGATGIKLQSLVAIAQASGLEQARLSFYEFSATMLSAVESAGAPHGQPLFRLYCPMVLNNRGGEWLQTDEEVRNPYFGASMLECGEVKSRVPPRKEGPGPKQNPQPDPHAGHAR